jgi:hypothetical protein
LQGTLSLLQDELFFVLPPLRGIDHYIDLIFEAALPNHTPNRTNPEENKEIELKIKIYSLDVLFVRALDLVSS